MPFVMNKIIVNKTGESVGTASVKLVDENNQSIILNKFQIDMNSGDGPVSVLRHEGTMLFNGDIVDLLKDVIFEMFEDALAGEPPGVYEIKKDEITRLK